MFYSINIKLYYFCKNVLGNLTCKKSCAQNKTVIPNMKGKPVDTQINKSCFVRRSSRLANKPSRNYFV